MEASIAVRIVAWISYRLSGAEIDVPGVHGLPVGCSRGLLREREVGLGLVDLALVGHCYSMVSQPSPTCL